MRYDNFVAHVMRFFDGLKFENTKHVSGCIYKMGINASLVCIGTNSKHYWWQKMATHVGLHIEVQCQ